MTVDFDVKLPVMIGIRRGAWVYCATNTETETRDRDRHKIKLKYLTGMTKLLGQSKTVAFSWFISLLVSHADVVLSVAFLFVCLSDCQYFCQAVCLYICMPIWFLKECNYTIEDSAHLKDETYSNNAGRRHDLRRVRNQQHQRRENGLGKMRELLSELLCHKPVSRREQWSRMDVKFWWKITRNDPTDNEGNVK